MVLDLSGNKLSLLPAEIGQLANLTVLDLSNNQLSGLPAEIGQLANLRELDLSRNQLSSLPAEILKLNMEIEKWEWKLGGGEEGIFLANNPWEKPPVEIIKQGTEAVRQYFKSLVEERTLNEAKVLLVGNGGAGKTSLVKRLIKNEFNENEPKTHGINIDDWQIQAKGETIKAHLWDYGGQGIMQATHRVFFSVRSLYILVLNAREEPDPEDWLMNIKSMGGLSPVMIVINMIDVNDYRLNEKHLVKKYPTIKGFYHISCKTGEGIEMFSKNLKEKLADVEMTRSKWGKDWLAVKERLEGLDKDYISYEEYEKICQDKNVKEEGQQKTLIEFLHELGVVLHFKEFSLEHMKILNPEWITEGIYKIINSKVLKDKKGVLDKKSLAFILNKEKFEDDDYEKGLKRSKYTKQEQVYVIDLMREFELCYEPDGDKVFVPNLFEEKEPEFDFDYQDCIRFYFEYEYLPGPVMPRFIVQRHRDIEGELRWQTGVVLKDEKLQSRALVRADKRQRRIYVYVSGRQKRDYFAVIRKTILDINDSFQELDIKEWIPLPDYETAAVEYAELIGQYVAGREKILIGKLGREYGVMKLLDGIENRKETELHIGQIIAGEKSRIEIGRRMEGNIVADEVNIEIKVEQAVEHLEELKKIVEEQPEEKLGPLVKRKGLEIIHDALKDVAKRQLTEAAKKIWELGKEMGPAIIKTVAYSFFKNMLGI
jgi:small GTP-binding protein